VTGSAAPAATAPAAPAVLRRDHGPVRVLTLNRPERRNALDLPDRRALLAELEAADGDPSCRAVVLTGTGEVFSAGGDIRSMSPDPVVARERLETVNAVARTMVTMGTPIVSAVEGGAFGLGLSLSCASDVVVAGRSARFVASFARLGLVADTGLFWTLPQRVGAGRARALLLTARTVECDEAERIGLVDVVVDDGSAVEHAVELATRLAGHSVPATAALKAILAQPDSSLEGVLAAEAEAQVDLLGGPDFAEGRQAFLERRIARFAGS
jgi:2-(1,2-epoxy-1,2-dihydrophenyl)acetyl-CoA isomerase